MSLRAWVIVAGLMVAGPGQAGDVLTEAFVLPTKGEAPVHSLAFSPDGKTLAAGCSGVPGHVQLWDMATGLAPAVLEAPGLPTAAGDLQTLAYSPDGKSLMALAVSKNNQSRFLTLWDTATGKERVTVKAPAAGFTAAAHLPDGKTLLVGDTAGNVMFRDTGTGKDVAGPRIQHTDTNTPVLSVAVAPAGDLIATGGRDDTARLWTAKGKPLGQIRDFPNNVDQLVFSPDGETLAGCSNGDVLLWDVTRAEVGGRFRARAVQARVAFSPDGKSLAITVSTGKSYDLTLWNLTTGRARAGLTLPAPPSAPVPVVFSPDGKLLAAAPVGASAVRVWRVAGGKGGFQSP